MTNQLITTFDKNNMTPNVDKFRWSNKKVLTENPLSATKENIAQAGILDPFNENHKRFGAVMTEILANVAEHYNLEPAVRPFNITVEALEIPEAGSVKGYRGIKPLQETPATQLALVLKRFPVVKTEVKIPIPEEQILKNADFNTQYYSLIFSEAGKEIARNKNEGIAKAMGKATETFAATTLEQWNNNAAGADPCGAIFRARKLIRDAKQGRANFIMANVRTLSQLIQNDKIKGLLQGINHPNYDVAFQFPAIPGMTALACDDPIFEDGEAFVFNNDRFVINVQSVAFLESFRDGHRGADVLRFLNFEDSHVWHNKACQIITGLI